MKDPGQCCMTRLTAADNPTTCSTFRCARAAAAAVTSLLPHDTRMRAGARAERAREGREEGPQDSGRKEAGKEGDGGDQADQQQLSKQWPPFTRRTRKS